MPSERVQRRIDRLLDQAEEAADQREWAVVAESARKVLLVDPDNEDAKTFLVMAEEDAGSFSQKESAPSKPAESVRPTSFSSGRYTVSKFLGEGGKKKVYLAHDNTLDRDIAFALIKTEGLDETSRERVKREAQAMGRMGTHPCIMPIYDLGDESGQPFMVQPLMGGGDVKGLVEDAEGPLELARAIEIATQTAQGLSYAHSKGIVHRDLKPGNVWLDEEGSAKIGDFGLAVATDRSRLTVEKVMVGTVSYMPPEQATGGEVTPRADLYSLGAMLYEMCTGRVPFMGDDDIGIISQHINTPPVAPSWHNNQIPKTLDSLILRLLAKDPSERPESADEVLAALEAVDLSAVEEREEGAGSLDSMAGGVFVGRHREMDQLKAIFEDVLSGKGRMVTLVGEPGIGKTRTAQELATYAGMRGAEVLWGRSYESGGAPPYWPWVQAIRSHVAATESETLRNQLSSTASVITEVVPDIKAKLPDTPAPTPIEDPESARFRLFDSISTFLKNTASATPLVLMLEDLHWSDKPSLMLLEFVARELANSRILIVGNYRDMELNRRHPLSVTLGDLSRERLFERVVLRGLQKHDVQRFIEIAAGIAPPPALTDTVFKQTEGNPLFVTETVRLLIQEGDITSGSSSKGGTTSWEIRIPEGVREVIGRRLDRLSERTNEVLSIAAVVGRQFRFPVLKMLMEETTEGQLLDALDEALSARIVDELPTEVGLYQFTHAQMQETLTGELSANRRVRMHARIAEALEEYYRDEAEVHAEELAEHFAEAETVLGTTKLIKYLATAGSTALQVLAYDDAARFLESAIRASNNSDPDLVALLHKDCAFACAAIREVDKALEHIEAAFSHFVKAGRNDLATEVATVYFSSGIGAAAMLPYLEKAVELVDKNSDTHIKIMSSLGRTMSMYDFRYEDALPLMHRALELATNKGDKHLEMQILADQTLAASWNDDHDLADQAATKAGELSSQVDDPFSMSQHYRVMAQGKVRSGNHELALELMDKAIESARRSGDRQRLATNYQMKSQIQSYLGQWTDARETSKQTLALLPDDSRIFGQRMVVSALTGNWSELSEWRAKLLENKEPEWADGSVFQLVALYTGRQEDLDAWRSIRGRESRGVHKSIRTEAGKLAEAALAALLDQNAAVAKPLIPKLLSLLPVRGYGPWPDTWAVVGQLGSLIGDNELAVEYHLKSMEHSRTRKRLPAIAMEAAEFANVLLDRNAPGDREKAIELQDEAISIAIELGMKPLLERVLAKREILKA